MVARGISGNRTRLIWGLLVACVLFGIMAVGLKIWGGQSTDTTVRLGEKQYKVRVLSTEAAREKGLSGTASLPRDQGMLFVFDSDDTWGIWMKDMHYPIDIVWLDHSKAVVDTAANVSPATYPTVFKPKRPAHYVLELAAGSIADASVTTESHAVFTVRTPEGEEL